MSRHSQTTPDGVLSPLRFKRETYGNQSLVTSHQSPLIFLSTNFRDVYPSGCSIYFRLSSFPGVEGGGEGGGKPVNLVAFKTPLWQTEEEEQDERKLRKKGKEKSRQELEK